MKIQSLTDEFFDEMCEMYCNYYSKSNRKVVEQTLRNEMNRDLSLVCLDTDGKLMGGIFCKVSVVTDYDGRLLHIQSVQVKPEYRKKGVARFLFREVLRKGKEMGLKAVDLDVLEGFEFPEKWYEKIGFKRIPWSTYEIEIDKIQV